MCLWCVIMCLWCVIMCLWCVIMCLWCVIMCLWCVIMCLWCVIMCLWCVIMCLWCVIMCLWCVIMCLWCVIMCLWCVIMCLWCVIMCLWCVVTCLWCVILLYCCIYQVLYGLGSNLDGQQTVNCSFVPRYRALVHRCGHYVHTSVMLYPCSPDMNQRIECMVTNYNSNTPAISLLASANLNSVDSLIQSSVNKSGELATQQPSVPCMYVCPPQRVDFVTI